MKKFLSILIVLTMLLSIASVPAFAEEPQISLYSGTPDLDFWGALYDDSGKPVTKEVTIMTADQLMGFAEMSSSNAFEGWTIKLGADMVINTGNAGEWADTAKAPAHKWKGGNSYGCAFAGTFDGQGHVISGLYTVGSSSKAAALIAYASGNATIQNVSIVNSYFTGEAYVSAVVGSYEPKKSDVCLTIKNVHVQDSFVHSSTQDSAGILGRVGGNTETNVSLKLEDISFVGGSITVGRHSGGVIGRIYNAKAYENGVALSMNRIALDTDITLSHSNTDLKAGAVIGNLNGFREAKVSNIFVGGTLKVTLTNAINTGAFVGILSNSAANVSGSNRALLKVENALIALKCENVNAVWFNRSATYNGTDIISATDELTNAYYDSDVLKIDATGATGCKAVMGKDTPDAETGKSFATLKGTDAGFTGWTKVTGDYPIPMAITAIDVNVYKNYVAPPPADDTEETTTAPEETTEAETTGNNGNETQTQAPAESETTPNTTEKKSGCSSVVGASCALIVLIALGGATVATKKSKK